MRSVSDRPDIVIAKITMPDGKEHEIPIPTKTFKSGRQGYFTQIPPMLYNGQVYGGQIQIWNKTKDNAQPE